MPQKTKNKKKVPPKKQWPDLPKMLLDIIGKDSTLMRNIVCEGVTQSWRAAAKQCNSNASLPWLQLFDDHFQVPRNYGDVTQPADQFNISFHRGYTYSSCRWPSQGPWNYFLGYSHNALVTRGTSDYIYLWYPDHGNYYCCLPEFYPKVPFMSVVIYPLNEDPSTRHCTVMVLTGTSHPAFVYYTLRGKGKSGSGKLLQSTNAIGFKGRFYALSLQGTVAEIIVDDEFNLRIRALSSKRAVPSVYSKHFTEYLVESDGRILLVFLISRKTTNVVDDVEVFRLNIEDLSWEKMGTLGEKTLFLGTNCCMLVSSSKARCSRNCVYFSVNTNDGWREFDMEEGSILPAWKAAMPRTEFPIWIEPVPQE
ncbi:hypothetical protein SLEP1_g25950 [Rubroshorea leprosula]|uniref:KIB1-4 beta-propeller domain-containing protein n=1 Tax=Rubroshorea leprosula TaxID=152421 RepID=A0AAV5JRP1_9ROSI|nr:hypothetical protein SLEP1_g25950 [Rubroshorea leprosula]